MFLSSAAVDPLTLALKSCRCPCTIHLFSCATINTVVSRSMMLLHSQVRALPGDVVRRSPKRPTEVFDSLVRYFNDQPGYDQMGVDVTVLSLAEHESWLEVDLMFEFVVFRVAVRVFEDEAEVPTSTVVSFRDLLRQDGCCKLLQ